MSAVAVHNLVKRYRNGKETVEAVKGISFEVAGGELFGIIGPDGAGKTSLFRMLTTLLLPDGGDALVDGSDIVKDYKAIRQKVGYMPGRFSLYPDLTVEENLQFFATIFQTTVAQNYNLIRDIYVQIEPFKTRRAGKLSGGMKQKLALCCALIHKPVVLFLDEPTTGVDAVSRKEFWDMLQNLKHQGITILVSTPYMDEASLCDRVALIQQGKIMSVDTPQAIIQSFPVKLYAAKSDDLYRLLNDFSENDQVDSSYMFGEYLHLSLKSDDPENTNNLRQYAEKKGHSNIIIKMVTPTIEDSFIRLMNSNAPS